MIKVKYIGGLGDSVTMNFQPGSQVFVFDKDQVLVLPDALAKQLLDSEFFTQEELVDTENIGE